MVPDRIAFTTAAYFFRGMLEPNYRDFLRDQTDLRHAFNAVISLFHMADWVFHTHEAKIRAAFAYRDKNGENRQADTVSGFRNALEQAYPDFGRMRGIANAGKHLKLHDIRPVQNAPSNAANTAVQIATTYLPGFLNVVMFGRGFPSKTIVLEGDERNDMKFSAIAASTYNMWKQLNETHKWW